ncbi:MAG: hypothetical protein NTV33_09110 [Coprothermobacterota bacterium]|nr:hypothetical protein [Coprothermobacterota bacterium]
MERERNHFDYGILLAIGLIGLAIMTGMIRLGWSGTLLLDLIQWVLVGVALACGAAYLIEKARRRYLLDRSRSTNKLPGSPAISHNPPRPGQPISRDRDLHLARGQADETRGRRSGPQTSFHRSPETHKGRRGQQSAVGATQASPLRSLPPAIQPTADAAPKPRRHRRRRGGRGKAPSIPPE